MYNILLIIPILNLIMVLLFGLNLRITFLITKTNLILIFIVLILWWEIILKGIIIKMNYYLYLDILNVEFIFNKLSINLVTLIVIIYSIVIKYSLEYLEEDSDINRFLIYMNLFLLTMLILVLSNNNLLFFIGWELVGLTSYLLINYWYNNMNNIKSGTKAILYNKIGDIFYFYSLLLLLNLDSSNNEWIYIGFIIAAIGKSAQLFLNGWLGDAMSGPTPVSSLLHAATMVCAGIYLLLKYKSVIVLNPLIVIFFTLIGLFTIILAGLTALFQNDIKKIIAYSTCSQLGYLFYSLFVGIDSYNHLLNHGFFKSLLFIISGYIIHRIYNTQDIRKYGSLEIYSPIYYILFLISSLSLMGFPFLSGYYSKDMILELSYFEYIWIYILSSLGAILTLLYSLRLLLLVFYNKPSYKVFDNSKLSSNYLLYLILILGSTLLGYYTNIIHYYDSEHLMIWIKWLPFFYLIILLVTIKKWNIILVTQYYISKWVWLFNKIFYVDFIYIKLSLKFLEYNLKTLYKLIYYYFLRINNSVKDSNSYKNVRINKWNNYIFFPLFLVILLNLLIIN